MLGVGLLREAILGKSTDISPETTPGRLFMDSLLTNQLFEVCFFLLIVLFILLLIYFLICKRSFSSDIFLYSSAMLVILSSVAFQGVSQISLQRNVGHQQRASLQDIVARFFYKMSRDWFGSKLVDGVSMMANYTPEALTQAKSTVMRLLAEAPEVKIVPVVHEAVIIKSKTPAKTIVVEKDEETKGFYSKWKIEELGNFFCEPLILTEYISCIKDKIKSITSGDSAEEEFYQKVEKTYKLATKELKAFSKNSKIFYKNAIRVSNVMKLYNASPEYFLDEAERTAKSLRSAFKIASGLKSLRRRENMGITVVGKGSLKKDFTAEADNSSIPETSKQETVLKSLQVFLFIQILLGLCFIVCGLCLSNSFIYICRVCAFFFLIVSASYALYLILYAHTVERSCILREVPGCDVEQLVDGSKSYKNIHQSMNSMLSETEDLVKILEDYIGNSLQFGAFLRIQNFQDFLRRIFSAKNDLVSLSDSKNGDIFANAGVLYRSTEVLRDALYSIPMPFLLSSYSRQILILSFLNIEVKRMESEIERLGTLDKDDKKETSMCSQTLNKLCYSSRVADRTGFILLFGSLILGVMFVL